METVETLMKSTFEEVERILSTKSVVADPILLDGHTVVPLDLRIVYDNRPGGRRAARLAWGFGLIRIRIRGGGPHEKPPKPKPRRTRRGGRRVRAALLTPGLPSAVAHRLRRLWAAIHIRLFEARAVLGTGDPADTGVLFGGLSGALAALPATRSTTLTVVPDFEAARADVKLRGRVRVVPGVVLGHLLATLLSPPALRALVRAARA